MDNEFLKKTIKEDIDRYVTFTIKRDPLSSPPIEPNDENVYVITQLEEGSQ